MIRYLTTTLLLFFVLFAAAFSPPASDGEYALWMWVGFGFVTGIMALAMILTSEKGRS